MIRANLDVVSTICGRIFAERSAAALAAAALAVAGLLATASAEDVTFPKPKYITTNGIRMAVYEQGEGIPVVFCHGFPELAYSWRHQLPALAKAGYHAIAADQRGYGLTDRPNDVDAYTIVHLCNDLVACSQKTGTTIKPFENPGLNCLSFWNLERGRALPG
jgi:hypothetical protein